MKSGDIGRQQAQYRRGLVLGFTVAETMLLILFALMLALGFVLMKRDRELRTLTGEISALREKQQFLETKLEVFQAIAVDPVQLNFDGAAGAAVCSVQYMRGQSSHCSSGLAWSVKDRAAP